MCEFHDHPYENTKWYPLYTGSCYTRAIWLIMLDRTAENEGMRFVNKQFTYSHEQNTT